MFKSIYLPKLIVVCVSVNESADIGPHSGDDSDLEICRELRSFGELVTLFECRKFGEVCLLSLIGSEILIE